MPTACPASDRRNSPRLGSWLVYWNMEQGLRALASNAPLDHVSVFAYQFNADNTLVPASQSVVETLEILRQWPSNRRPQVLVTVVNDRVAGGRTTLKDPACVHDVLADAAARTKHVDELLEVADAAQGLELDYENVRAADREAFSALIRELAERLHTRGRILSVVVQPKTSDVVKDGSGAIDWRAIGASADIVKVMAYHYHYPSGPPGPIAPPGWVAQVARFAKRQVPAEKLCVILTLAGFDWAKDERAFAVHHDQAALLATQHDRPIERDRATASPWFRYSDEAGRDHEVWFEDSVSLDKKMAALRKVGVRRVGLWYLGVGDTAFWLALSAPKD